MKADDGLKYIEEYRQRFLFPPGSKYPEYYSTKIINGIFAINTLSRQYNLSPDEDAIELAYNVSVLFFKLSIMFEENDWARTNFEQAQEEIENFMKFLFNKEKIQNDFREYCKEHRKLVIASQI